MRIAVVGGGSWGSALANMMSLKGFSTSILVRRKEHADEINASHRNARYLPNLVLPSTLAASANAEETLGEIDIAILAVPCQTMRLTLQAIAKYLPESCIPVCVSKGIEVSGLCRMSQVVKEELPAQSNNYAILSGPSFAEDVTLGKPTAVVLGCQSQKLGETLRQQLSTPTFRVYSTTDIVGVELGGALKNIMAIAAGISDGLGLGHSARAALITRGISEISRLGVALGAEASTFMGLSGMGDLVLTCTGDLSRNRQVGLRLGQGQALPDILGSMHNVAEGVQTTQAACTLAHTHHVEVPIISTVHAILQGQVEPAKAVQTLMSRNLKEE